MKKSPFLAALLLLGLVLAGCPVYDDDDGTCYYDDDCAYGRGCDVNTNTCERQPTDEAVECLRPSDCGSNETCSRFGICTSGDCHFSTVGCVRGYECSGESGRWQCVKAGSVSAGGNGGAANAGADSEDGGQTSEGGTTAASGAGG